MEAYTQTQREATLEKDQSNGRSRLVNDANTILNNDASISESRKNNFLFYISLLPLASIAVWLISSESIYSAKLIAAVGIIFSLTVIRRFDLKQKK